MSGQPAMHSHATTASSSVTELPSAPADSTPRPPSSPTDATNGINSRSKLVALPEELLSNIAVRLGPDDLFALRLTCRDVEFHSRHEFAKEYFAAKCFMFTTSSLKVLVGISESARLKGYLKDVYFVTTTIRERPSSCPRGAACQPNTRQREALIDYQTDQEKLKSEGRDKELLTKAFKNLPNVNLLALIGDTHFLPDGVECWGMRKFKRSTKTSPVVQPATIDRDDEFFTCLSHVWRTMMLAVGQSGITTIKRLETRFGSENAMGLSPIADLRFKDSTIEVLSRCFANLEDLSICFRSKDFRTKKPDKAGDMSKATKYMKSFSPVLRNAKNVKLSSDFGNNTGVLAKAFLTTTFDLSKLKALVLDALFIDVKALAFIICKLKSVEFLTIHHVEVTEGTWVPILKALQNLPTLQHLHLFYLQEPQGRCFFLAKLDEPNQAADRDPFDFFDDPLADPADANWEDSSDASDEMPDLVDGNTVVNNDEQHATDPVQVAPAKPRANECPFYEDEDFRDKVMPKSAGRGYFVCVQGIEIQEKLPTFIKEYNTSGDMGAGDPTGLMGILQGGIVGGPFPVATAPNGGPANAAPVPGAQGGQAGGGQGGAGGGPLGMLAGILAGPPPAPGGTQTYSFNMPLSALLGGGFGAPPPNPPGQQPPTNAAQGQTTTQSATNTNQTQAGPGTTAAGPSSVSATVEDDDDDDLPDLVALDQNDWMAASDIDDEGHMNDVD